MASQVELLVEEIKESLNKNRNCSQEDEVKVMQAMLNDKDFKVDLYNRKGEVNEYCPAKEFKRMESSIIASALKISKDEAASLMDDYQVSKSEAEAMVNISKQFINTYVDTDRKMSLGSRTDRHLQIGKKVVPERSRPCPKKIGVSEDGKSIYESPIVTKPEHITLKVYALEPGGTEEI